MDYSENVLPLYITFADIFVHRLIEKDYMEREEGNTYAYVA